MIFYFNHSSGKGIDDLATYFKTMIVNYHSLLMRRELRITKGIVTEKDPENLTVNHLSLQNLIRNIDDKNIKRLAYTYFTKYPAEAPSGYDFDKVYREYQDP